MNSTALLLWLLNTVMDATGQLAFKAAALTPAGLDTLARWRYMAARPWLWLGVFAFIMEFVVWLAFLSLVPLAEGVLLGMVNIVVVMLLARWFFHEKLSPMRVAGILLIAVGVSLVGAG